MSDTVLYEWEAKGKTYQLLPPRRRADKFHRLVIIEEGYSTVVHGVMPEAVSRQLLHLAAIVVELGGLDHEPYDDDCMTVYVPMDTWEEIQKRATKRPTHRGLEQILRDAEKQYQIARDDQG